MFKIAIVGRPNVGKSALFNRITGRRRAIVEDVEGVTRDRLYERCDIFGKHVMLIDTGGIDYSGTIDFSEKIRLQTMKAIAEADMILFMVDGTCDITLQDEEVSRVLHSKKKPIYLVVNKIDNNNLKLSIDNFHPLGHEKIFGVSAIHGCGLGDLLEVIANDIKIECAQCEKILPKVAIIGRPNVGKSTLLNHIADEERSIVSDIPGTTRDAIDLELDNCVFIDTAGIRKKKSESEAIDKFAFIRTEKIIERCDICILVIDVNDGFTAYEKRIIQMVEDAGKGCIILVNKWDQVSGVLKEKVINSIKQINSFISHIPIIVGSALTGNGLSKLFRTIFEVQDSLNRRVTTGELNSFLERAIQLNHPPMIQGKRLRIYYLTQVSTKPPVFVLFVNKSELLIEDYRKYLLNQLRDKFSFSGSPIRFKLKQKDKPIVRRRSK